MQPYVVRSAGGDQLIAVICRIGFGTVNILVLGATGVLGNAVFRSLSKASSTRVSGTIRADAARGLFASELADRLIVVDDIENPGLLAGVFGTVRPDVVIICVAVGRPAPADPMRSIAVYSVLPRRLA